MAALAVVGTTFAQLVYFHMLPLYGNPRISLVAYIMPVFAIAYGALFLDEVDHGRHGHRAWADPRRRRARVGPRPRLAAGKDRGRDPVSVVVRRAQPDDLDFLVGLAQHEDVSRSRRIAADRSRGVLGDIERSGEEPDVFRVFVIEVDSDRAGVMRFMSRGGPNRIADLGGLAVHPDFRGRKVADEAADLPATTLRRARLPPAPARGLRLQRPGHAPCRAFGLCARGSQAARVPARRRVGRRRHVRADSRRPARRLERRPEDG